MVDKKQILKGVLVEVTYVSLFIFALFIINFVSTR